MTGALEDFGHVVWPGASGLVAIAPGFEYRELPAPAPVRELVACVWSSRVAKSEQHVQRTFPDGCVEIVLPDEGGALVYGPDADWSDVPLDAGAAYSGVRLRPGAGRALLRLDLQELAGTVVPLADVEPSGRLSGASLTQLLAAIARSGVRETDRLVVEAACLMEQEPRSGLREFARRLAISERQLRRRFERTIGLRPSSYARIVRVQRAVRLALENRLSWTEVAYESGFSDHAYLSREVRRVTGFSPSRLIGGRDGYPILRGGRDEP